MFIHTSNARWINQMDLMHLTSRKSIHNIYVENARLWDTIAEETKCKISLYIDKVLSKQQGKETNYSACNTDVPLCLLLNTSYARENNRHASGTLRETSFL